VVEIEDAKGNPFQQSDFAVHPLDKATGEAMRKKLTISGCQLVKVWQNLSR